jgi:hypothetical protein
MIQLEEVQRTNNLRVPSSSITTSSTKADTSQHGSSRKIFSEEIRASFRSLR